jgi:hypothetical protein
MIYFSDFGGVSSPVVRGVPTVDSGSSGTLVWPLPVGATAGDRVVVFFGGYWTFTGGTTGVTLLDDRGGTNWQGRTVTKILDGTDITNGSITTTQTPADHWVAAGVCFVGAAGGVRTWFSSRNSTGATSRSITTDSAPRSGDYAIAFGSGRLNADATSDLGTELDEEHSATKFGVLNGGLRVSNGAVSANFSYGTTPSGDYQSVVVLGGTPSVTLNSSDKHADIALYNGNLTAMKSSGDALRSVRVNTGIAHTGKFYCEFQFLGSASPDSSPFCLVGVSTSSMPLTSYVGHDTNSVGFYQDSGEIYKNLVGTAYGSSWKNGGDRIGIAYDNGKIWARVNGGAWPSGGNPATGTGGYTTGLTGTLYVTLSVHRGTTANHEIRLLPLTGDFIDTPPSGFPALA